MNRYTIKLTEDEMVLVNRAISRLQSVLGTNLAEMEQEGDPDDLVRAQQLCEDIGSLDRVADKLHAATGESG